MASYNGEGVPDREVFPFESNDDNGGDDDSGRVTPLNLVNPNLVNQNVQPSGMNQNVQPSLCNAINNQR